MRMLLKEAIFIYVLSNKEMIIVKYIVPLQDNDVTYNDPQSKAELISKAFTIVLTKDDVSAIPREGVTSNCMELGVANYHS